MPSKNSVFEYDVVKLTDYDLSKPVTVLHETNDGYHVILDAESLKGKRLQASSTEDERGGTWVKSFDSFRDMLLADDLWGYGGEEDENGNITFQPLEGDEPETLEQILKRMGEGDDAMVLGGGVLVVKALKGSYRDPERLLTSMVGGEDDDEDDED